MRFLSLFTMGAIAGSMIAVQSVLNAALAKKTGNLGLTTLPWQTVGF
jgi:hypothetical protein